MMWQRTSDTPEENERYSYSYAPTQHLPQCHISSGMHEEKQNTNEISLLLFPQSFFCSVSTLTQFSVVSPCPTAESEWASEWVNVRIMASLETDNNTCMHIQMYGWTSVEELRRPLPVSCSHLGKNVLSVALALAPNCWYFIWLSVGSVWRQ